MTKISKNAAAIIFLVVSAIGLDIPEKVVEDAVFGTIAIVSFGLMLWNQLGRKELKFGIFRK
jgi:hypothetical protein